MEALLATGALLFFPKGALTHYLLAICHLEAKAVSRSSVRYTF